MNVGVKTMLLGIGLILFGIFLSLRGLGTVESFLGTFIIRGAVILGMIAIIAGYFRD